MNGTPADLVSTLLDRYDFESAVKIAENLRLQCAKYGFKEEANKMTEVMNILFAGVK